MSFGNLSNMQMASAGPSPMAPSTGAQRLDTSKPSSTSVRSMGNSSMGASAAGGGGGFSAGGMMSMLRVK